MPQRERGREAASGRTRSVGERGRIYALERDDGAAGEEREETGVGHTREILGLDAYMMSALKGESRGLTEKHIIVLISFMSVTVTRGYYIELGQKGGPHVV